MCIEAALARRAGLLNDPQTDAVRLLHGEADGAPGLVVEKFADTLIAQLHEDRLGLHESQVYDLCAALAERVGAARVYRKNFVRDRSQRTETPGGPLYEPTPWIGAASTEELTAHENDMRLRIRPYDGYSVGLFLDQRDNRRRVRELAAGRKVLNTFAYTCSFGVAAALGGATETINVDDSRKALDWGRRNYEANGVSPDGHIFLRADVFDYLKRSARQGRRFDLVILDPPTFARSRQSGRVFSLAEDLDRLVAATLDVLSERGVLLLSVNHRHTSLARLERSLIDAARRVAPSPRERPRIERGELPADFPGDPDYRKALWAWY